MRSMQFDPVRAAPLKFLVFDFALTAHNIGPPGQETYGRPELMGPSLKLPLKAGNSKQRHRPFLCKITGSTTQFQKSEFFNSL